MCCFHHYAFLLYFFIGRDYCKHIFQTCKYFYCLCRRNRLIAYRLNAYIVLLHTNLKSHTKSYLPLSKNTC